MIVLADRSHSGVNACLTWHGADSLTLEVTDPIGTETLHFSNGAEALDAFNHPYVYLDAARPDPFSPRLRSEDDADIIGAEDEGSPLGTIDPRD